MTVILLTALAGILVLTLVCTCGRLCMCLFAHILCNSDHLANVSVILTVCRTFASSG